MNAIDHQSQIPYYIQVKDVIRERIRNRVWQPNDQLPSEAELCEAFDVSRTVIRQALQDLIHDGLIIRRKGKGSFVAPAKISEQLVQKLTGFYHDMIAQGYHPVTRVLKQSVIPSSPKVAANLGITAGTPVIEIVRQRFVEDIPIVLVTSYLPHALCPGLINDDLSSQSLYDLLEKNHHLYIARGRRVMQAVPASENEAQLLQVDKGAPLFLLDSISYLDDDTPVEYYYAYHRGDRSQFEVELIRLREVDGEAQFESLPPSNTVAAS
jgi:GntR family transcriptional regulator